MDIQKALIYDKVLNHKKNLHLFSTKAATPFLSAKSKYMFFEFLKNKRLKNDNKYFKITNSTKSRVSNMPTQDINGGKLIGLKENSGDTGLVVFEDKLHFVYAITKSGIHIAVSESDRSTVWGNEAAGSYKAYNLIIGYIYMDFISESFELCINSPLDVENKDNTLFKDKGYLKEITRAINKDLDDKFKKEYVEDHQNKFNKTRLCLQSFIFIYCANVYDTTVISEDNAAISLKDRLAGVRKNELKIIQVDSFYDKNIKVINPFAVSGHFRNQPYGENRLQKKLIYIDSFMKTGYTRESTKSKIGLNNRDETNPN